MEHTAALVYSSLHTHWEEEQNKGLIFLTVSVRLGKPLRLFYFIDFLLLMGWGFWVLVWFGLACCGNFQGNWGTVCD